MLPSSWKRDIASGLIILVPLLITVYVVAVIYQTLANIPYLNTALSKALANSPYLNEELSGLDTVVQVAVVLALFALLVISIGYLMRTALGDVLEAVEGGLKNVAERGPHQVPD